MIAKGMLLKAEDVKEIAEELCSSMIDLAEGLNGLDIDDLIEKTSDTTMREIFLAAAEFKASMNTVMAREKRTWH